MKTTIAMLCLAGAASAAAAEFRTPDPLKAFVNGSYQLGSDYFIRGKSDTVLLRCVLRKPRHAFDGVAFSEQSIRGNRGGDWEVFRGGHGTDFIYVGTSRLASHACLESCLSNEFLSTGRCTWKRGWPKGGS